MSTITDIEQLMIKALDGQIAPHESQVLHVYLESHPDERAMFGQMMAIDHAMQLEPAPAVPAMMTQQVMGAIRLAKISQPLFKPLQIAFLIGFPSILLLLFGSAAISMYILFISPAFPQTELQTVLALVRAATDIVGSLLVALIAVLRALYSQPITWAITIVLSLAVAGWLRIIASIWLPARRLAS